MELLFFFLSPPAEKNKSFYKIRVCVFPLRAHWLRLWCGENSKQRFCTGLHTQEPRWGAEKLIVIHFLFSTQSEGSNSVSGEPGRDRMPRGASNPRTLATDPQVFILSLLLESKVIERMNYECQPFSEVQSNRTRSQAPRLTSVLFCSGFLPRSQMPNLTKDDLL